MFITFNWSSGGFEYNPSGMKGFTMNIEPMSMKRKIIPRITVFFLKNIIIPIGKIMHQKNAVICLKSKKKRMLRYKKIAR